MSNGNHVVDGHLTPAGYVQMTSLAAATVISSIPDNTEVAVIQAETQNVRWRDDGTSPTTSVGMILVAGDSMVYNGTMSALKFIEVTASAKLNITYYK